VPGEVAALPREVPIQVDPSRVAALEGPVPPDEARTVDVQRVGIDDGHHHEVRASSKLIALAGRHVPNELEQRHRPDELDAMDQSGQQHRRSVCRSPIEAADRPTVDGRACYGDSSPRLTGELTPALVELVGVGVIGPRRRKHTHNVTIACQLRSATVNVSAMRGTQRLRDLRTARSEIPS